jgi:hypothetical protein
MSDQDHFIEGARREPWNKGRLIGQKRPLRPKDVWAIRVRLQIGGLARDLALFNLAVDSKLRACDLVALRISYVEAGGRIRERATIVQKKTGRPARRFETGWQPWAIALVAISSPAGSEETRICPPASTHASELRRHGSSPEYRAVSRQAQELDQCTSDP